jgi:hypothetical protein
MNRWFSKDLGDAMLAFEELDQIEAQYRAIYGQQASPNDVAVFTRHNSEGSLHCRVEVFFSPAASELAKQMNAQPCNKPSSNDLGLLAGTEASWTALFPEQRR